MVDFLRGALVRTSPPFRVIANQRTHRCGNPFPFASRKSPEILDFCVQLEYNFVRKFEFEKEALL